MTIMAIAIVGESQLDVVETFFNLHKATIVVAAQDGREPFADMVQPFLEGASLGYQGEGRKAEINVVDAFRDTTDLDIVHALLKLCQPRDGLAGGRHLNDIPQPLVDIPQPLLQVASGDIVDAFDDVVKTFFEVRHGKVLQP